MRSLMAALAVWMLVACSSPDPSMQIAPQKWNDIVVKVETRPTPMRVGMNELLILATLERGMPVHDLIVSMRADERDSWHQGIQDGHSGVYRKAINVPSTATHIFVQLRKKRSDEEAELKFPVNF